MHSGNSKTVQVMQALGGGFSGAVTRFVTQPCDVIKIRFQMQVEPLSKHASSKYTGMIQALTAVYKEEGVRGLWKGHNSGQAMSISYALVQFWSYEQLRTSAQRWKFFRENVYVTYFVCGGTAGCLGVVASQPFDLVRTRVVASDPASGTSTLGTLNSVRKVLKHEGIRGLFRGITMTLVQVYPFVGANFLIYKSLNEMAAVTINSFTDGDTSNSTIPGALLLVNGSLAGVISKFIVYPADLLKKRLQLGGFKHDRQTYGRNPNCPNVRSCIVNLLENEGISGFYKGMAPTLVKSGLTSAVYFTMYDVIRKLYIEPYRDKQKSTNVEKC